MWGWILGIGLPLLFVAGAASAVDALLRSRDAQGTTAWILSLVLIPYVALPLYWLFGRRHFSRYAELQDEFDEEFAPVSDELTRRANGEWSADTDAGEIDERTLSELKAFECLGDTQFTSGNEARLLIDGDAMFPALFEAIDSAQRYVLVQFYVIRADDIGTRFKDHLIKALGRGAAVYLLYDEIGSMTLPDEFVDELTQAGARVSSFSGNRSRLSRFRLNFRNHRKIAVVDGERGLVGGLNVGDEYLGRDESIGNWRDTHMELAGPAVTSLQLAFLRDWYYGCQEIPDVLRWKPARREQNAKALIASSGPHSQIENCGLLFAHLISSAEQRLWIASPYFVPDGRVVGALQLAAMRGVDVRVIVPRRSDNPLFRYVPYAFFGDVKRAGVRLFFYENDFMHQKVLIVDDDYAVVSTANLDNRSFHLNFEVSCVVRHADFCQEIDAMLRNDLANSTEIETDDLATRSFTERLATQATRLLAPLL